MARGRKPQPDAVVEAKGNPGRRRRRPPTTIDQSGARRASAPPELNDEEAKVWASLEPELSRLNFLRDQDRPALARYCVYLVEWWALTATLKAEGRTYWTETNHGKMRRIAPEALLRRDNERQMVALEDRFGLTPAARQQILQRLSGILAGTNSDDLFAGQEDGDASSDRPPAPASPVGLLGSGSVH